MAQPPNLFPLKMFVISLGILLVGGTIVLFATIASKAGQEVAAHCPDATLDLHGKGTIVSVIPQGETVQVTLAMPPKTALLTVDRCSGKVIQTLTIEP